MWEKRFTNLINKSKDKIAKNPSHQAKHAFNIKYMEKIIEKTKIGVTKSAAFIEKYATIAVEDEKAVGQKLSQREKERTSAIAASATKPAEKK